jgi:hypothetical protein
MNGCMGGPLSISGRFIKINACLANVVVYQMSLRIFHKTNIEKLKKPIRTFPWAGNRKEEIPFGKMETNL